MKKLKPHVINWAQIGRFLASADKKLSSARKMLAFDEEACLQQAYDAMLKASLGFMFSHGFRARSQPGHHIAIIEFVRARIDKKHSTLLTVFDRLRRFMTMLDSFPIRRRSKQSKPHLSIYVWCGMMSRREDPS
jgi:uncharacterized protein (UPF0332 family)